MFVNCIYVYINKLIAYQLFQDLSSLPPVAEFDNFNKLFKLSADLLKETEQFSDGAALSKSDDFKISKKPSAQNRDDYTDDIFKDEGYDSTPPRSPQNIWELASKLKYSRRRNWENFGYPEPEKERPFLSELGDLSSLWVENLESLYFAKLFKDGAVYNSKLVSRKTFIRDLKYLLGKFYKNLIFLFYYFVRKIMTILVF